MASAAREATAARVGMRLALVGPAVLEARAIMAPAAREATAVRVGMRLALVGPAAWAENGPGRGAGGTEETRAELGMAV